MTRKNETLKFNTGNAFFAKDYIEKSNHQRSYNRLAIEYLSEKISSWFQKNSEISILDLCCGDGSSTAELLNSLLIKNINVKQIIGYDISQDQIEFAMRTQRDPRLIFKVMDAEKLEEQQQYHVVISLFGFHWFEHIRNFVPKVHAALKPEGRVIFLVPLEKEELFHLRQQCISSETWANYFENYTLHPFHYSAVDYMDPFTEYFLPESGNSSGDEIKKFTKDNFAKFLGSWLQEERYLRLKFGESIAQKYIRFLVDSIQKSPNQYAYLSKDEDNKIQFIERYLFWQGKRRSSVVKNYDMVNVPPLTPLQASLTKGHIGFFNPEAFIEIESNEVPVSKM